MKKIYTLLFVGLGFFASTQETLTLKPGPNEGKDTEIAFASIYDGDNLGDLSLIGASAWTWSGEASKVNTIIDFDWSQLPQGAIVTNAILKFYAFNGENGSVEYHSTLNGSNESWLNKITEPWDEHLITNSNPPAYTEMNRVSVQMTDSVTQDIEINVTQLVNDILENPSEGYGFYWKLQTEEHYRRIGFCSSDNSDANKWPEITITYNLTNSINENKADFTFVNPVNDKITLKNLKIANQSFQIVDLQGRIIKEGKLNSSEINVEKLIPATYLFVINNSITKFIKM